MVGHVLLFHPAFIKIKEIVDLGQIGNLQYIYSNRLNFGTIRTNENVFWSFAPHDIALFQYYTNSMPLKISSTGMDILQDGIHDTTITSLKYRNKETMHPTTFFFNYPGWTPKRNLINELKKIFDNN